MIPIHFAPLQGYTEDIYRRLHHRIFGGVDTYYTPFVRWEHGEVRSKDLRDIAPQNNADLPLVPQIIASSGKEAQHLLDILLPMGYRQIDINMGCPFPLQTRHRRGAGILQHPDQVEELCQLVRQQPQVSFSIKMRLGLSSSDEWQHILPLLNEVPLHHITLHPRIASQQYKGEVDMEAFSAFLSECKHPVVYNGDIRSLQDIRKIEEQFPQLAGIMIGRGLLARPSLAIEYQSGEEWSKDRVMEHVMQMHDNLAQQYAQIIPGESQQLQKLRTFWDFYEPSPEDPNPLLDRKRWKKLMKAGNMKNYMALL